MQVARDITRASSNCERGSLREGSQKRALRADAAAMNISQQRQQPQQLQSGRQQQSRDLKQIRLQQLSQKMSTHWPMVTELTSSSLFAACSHVSIRLGHSCASSALFAA